MDKQNLTAELLRELVAYDPETGIFTRKVRMAQCHQVGDRADTEGYGNLSGYRLVGLFGKKWLAHRLAWLYVHGAFPGKQIDHINGDKGDNRILNLRDVTTRVNSQNKRNAMKTSKSGLLGAAWHPQSRKWRARIQVGKKFIQIGMFESAEDAHSAYVAAKRKYHEGCTI